MDIRDYVENRLSCMEAHSNEDMDTDIAFGIVCELWILIIGFKLHEFDDRIKKQHSRTMGMGV